MDRGSPSCTSPPTFSDSLNPSEHYSSSTNNVMSEAKYQFIHKQQEVNICSLCLCHEDVLNIFIICIHIYIDEYAHRQVRACTSIHAHEHDKHEGGKESIYARTSNHTHARAQACARMHTQTRANTQIRIRKYAHACVRTYTRVRTRVHTHKVANFSKL